MAITETTINGQAHMSVTVNGTAHSIAPRLVPLTGADDKAARLAEGYLTGSLTPEGRALNIDDGLTQTETGRLDYFAGRFNVPALADRRARVSVALAAYRWNLEGLAAANESWTTYPAA